MSESHLPLKNQRIVVTRRAEQAPELAEKLAALGATPLLLPAIALEGLPAEPLLWALRSFAKYDWVLFTSGNAVRFFLAEIAGLTVKWPRVAASGPATAAQLRAAGVRVDFVPDEYVGEALIDGLGDVSGQRIFVPRARLGRPLIVSQLRERGARVEEIHIYDTVTAPPDETKLLQVAAGFDAVTFTSSSTVNGFMQLTETWPAIRKQLKKTVVACIGPVTAKTAGEAGLTVDVIPDDYTLDGLVGALSAHFGAKR